jgi:hypothetical protein
VSSCSQRIIRPRQRTVRHTLLLLLPALVLSACETRQERVAKREDYLAAAGFVLQPANTPERQGMINRLPANRFVRKDRGQDVTYVYADPLVCGCLYVGSQAAYDRYRANMLQQRIANEQAVAAQLSYNDGWDWGGWGPGYGALWR